MCKIRKITALRRKNSQKLNTKRMLYKFKKNSQKLKTRRMLFKFKNPIHKTLKKNIKKLFIMCKIRKMMAIRRKNSQKLNTKRMLFKFKKNSRKLKTRRRSFKFKNPIHKTLKKYIKKIFIMMIIYLKNKRKLKIFRKF